MDDRALTKFQEISALLNSSFDQTEIRRRALDVATALMDAEAGSLLLLAGDSGELYFEVAVGPKQEHVQQVRVKVGQGIAGYVAQSGEPLIVNDVPHDPRFWPEVDANSGFETRDMVCVPVKARDRILGVLQAINKRGGQGFTDEHLANFVMLGHQVGIAIDNAALYEEINRLFEGFVWASVQAIESRDPATSGHSYRVALLTEGLAEVVNRCERGPYAPLSFDDGQLKEIRFAALLHDFGKVGVREHILVKARKLYPSDLALVRARFDFIKRTMEAEVLRQQVDILRSGSRDDAAAELRRLDRDLARRMKQLDEWLGYLLECNEPDRRPARGFQALEELAKLRYESFDGPMPYLTPEEAAALSVPEGTLTSEERREIESHVTHTYDYLRKIPWSHSLRNVPTIAYRHHENLDGSGYPRRVAGEDIPVQARMMTIADLYDALTASDRPYRGAMSPATALAILEGKSVDGKIDPHLFGLFVEAKVYLRIDGLIRDGRDRPS